MIFKKYFWLLSGIGLLDMQRLAGMQSVIAPPPVTPITPLSFAGNDTNAMNNAAGFIPTGEVNINSLPKFLRYGSLDFRPHVTSRFLYGTGLQSGTNAPQNTAIYELSPGLLVDIGRHWSVDYTPTIRFYSNNKFNNGVDHSVSLMGGTQFDDWTFGVSHSSIFTSAPEAETAAQTDQQSHSTALTAARTLNSQMSADFGLYQRINFAEGLQNSYDWSTLDWLNYQFWPRLTTGIGVGAGYVNEDLGPDQTYEQLQARIQWHATEKISLQISGGGEDRQFANSGMSDELTPVFSAAIQYQPFKDTQFSLTASRVVAPALVPGSDTTLTSVGVSLNQKLFKEFQLSVGASYNLSEYTETGLVLKQLSGNTYQLALRDIGRTDNIYTLTVRLSHPLFKRGTGSIFYQYSDSQSSAAGFGYNSNQVGIEIGYSY